MSYYILVTPSKDIVDAYGDLIKEKLKYKDCEAYLLTLFNPLPGSPAITIKHVHQLITTFYSGLVARIVRRPATRIGKDQRPLAIFFIDAPDGLSVMDKRAVLVNDGMHMYGSMVVIKKSRPKGPLDVHILRRSTSFCIWQIRFTVFT